MTADPWETINTRMGEIYGLLNEACEAFTDEWLSRGGDEVQLHAMAVELAKQAGIDSARMNDWTMGHPLVPARVICRDRHAVVFSGPFQPAWALFLRAAYDARELVRSVPA